MAFDWRGIVRTVAPTLATALGGPLAGTAVKLIGDKLLGNPDATEAEIEAALVSATPEDLLRLKGIEQEFKLELKKLGIREQELRYADTADARDMATKTSIAPQVTVITLYNVAFFSVLAWLISQLYNSGGGSIDPAILSLVSGALGVLLGEIPRQMQFLFGSSQGSKQKTAAMNAAMADAVKQAAVQQRVLPQPPRSQPPAPVSTATPSTVLDDS